MDDHRVQVHLLDPGVACHKIRNPQEKVANGLHVGGLFPPDPFQDARAADLGDHFRGVFPGQRDDPERHVLHHLDHDPAEAEHHRVPELEVPRHADDDLLAGGRHGGHERAAVRRPDPPGGLPDAPVRLPDPFLVCDIQDHPPHVGFVRNVGGVHLQDDGKTDEPGRVDRLLLARNRPRVGHGETVSGEERHRFGGGHRPYGPLRLPRRRGSRPLRRERFPVEPRVAGQGLDRPLRRREDGDLLLVHLPPLLPFHIGPAQVGDEIAFSGTDDIGGACDRIAEDRHDHVVVPFRGGQDLPVAIRVGVPREIEGVSHDAVGGENFLEPAGEVRREGGDAESLLLGHVRRDDGRPPRTGDDQGPRPRRRRQVRERLGEVVQLLEGGRAVHTVLAEHGVVDLVLSREGPGVGFGRLSPPLRPPRLEDHDGLSALAQGRKKFPRVLHSLDVEGDDQRVRVVREKVDQVRLVDVRPVAHAHERREAEPVLGRPVGKRRAHGPALGHDRDLPPARDERPGGAQSMVRVVDSLAVGADQADAAAVGVSDQVVLERGSFLPGLGESPRDDDRGTHLSLPQLEDGGGHELRRDDDDREIRSLGNLTGRPDGRSPQDHFPFRVHGEDIPGESGFQDVPEDLEPHLFGVGRRADHGDASGSEKGREGGDHRGTSACRPFPLPAERGPVAGCATVAGESGAAGFWGQSSKGDPACHPLSDPFGR